RGLLRRRLLPRRLLPAAPLRRAGVAAHLQQLGRPLVRQALDGVALALAQRRVGLAVGHVRPVAPALDHHRPAADRIGTELAERGRRRLPPPTLRLGERPQRLLDGDREQLLLGAEAARLGALLQVRAVTA